MGSKLEREHARVCNTNILGAIDNELRVDDATLFLRQHRARHCGVVLCADLTREPRLPVRVCLDGGPGVELAGQVCAQRGGAAELSGELEALAHEDEVCRWEND